MRHYVIFGSGGIGLCLARRLLAKGAAVTLASRRAESLASAAAALAAPLASGGGALTTAAVDASDAAAVEAVCAAAVERAGGDIAGLCFAAGSIPLASLRAAKPADVLAAFTLNAPAPAQRRRAVRPCSSPLSRRRRASRITPPSPWPRRQSRG